MTKKLLSTACAGLFSFGILQAQTLFTYGSKPVSQQEFIRAFEKNPDSGNRRKAMEEYLPLYINYKLKVQDAYAKKLDTLPSQRVELTNYRSQLEESFINEKSNTESLVQEALLRSQKDILLGHLFIAFDARDSASFNLAKSQADKAEAALKARQDFAQVVTQFSTDAEAKATNGVAGWITAFSLPYVYETPIYNLPIGGTTTVIKGSTGFHIFKKIAERPAAGRVQVAQILLVNTDANNTATSASTKRLADSLYLLLKTGADFGKLAQLYSNDRTSYSMGGILPEFGVGTYDEVFEKNAFMLKNKGEIGQPFKTGFGWHILRLENKHPITTEATAEEQVAIKQKVVSTGRTLLAQENYIQTMLPKMPYKAGSFLPAQLWQYTDSLIKGVAASSLKINNHTTVFSLGKQAYSAAEWVQFVKSARATPGKGNKPYADLLNDFVQFSAKDYLRQNLDKLEPSFAAQLKEFSDANLLFDIMDKNVWTKAAQDSTGLASYYARHQADYKWNESANALLVSTADSALANKLVHALQAAPANWQAIIKPYADSIMADSSRYDLSQIPVNQPVHFAKGLVTEPVKNELDGSRSFVVIFDVLPTGQQRSFEEARGFVINDYQQVIEQKWLADLNKKYPVKVNQSAWKKLLSAAK